MNFHLPADPRILPALGGIFGLLVVATLVHALLKKLKPELPLTEVGLRIQSWWVMAGVFSLAMALSKNISLGFFALVSFLALKEYLSLIPTRRADRGLLAWVYLAIPIQFFWIGIGWYGMFSIFVPVYMFLFLPASMALSGDTEGFLKAVGTLHWGLMTMVYSLSHLAFLLVMPARAAAQGEAPANGPSGAALVLFLVFLTQFNDVAQFLWGKTLGRHKVVPKTSPNKTYEGLLGGVATTVTLALLLHRWLTPFTLKEALGAGLLIGFGGFLGDIIIGALKRDLGIKDAGTMLPGHGGILDRVNSLIFTAPLFFHYTRFLHF